MTKAFWQAKIWGLLHDPALKALQDNSGRGGNGFWRDLAVMQDWVENNWNPEESGGTALKHIHDADYLASASDRAAIGSLTNSVDYDRNGLEITHLLSGARQLWRMTDSEHNRLFNSKKNSKDEQKRVDYLKSRENDLLPEFIKNNDDSRLVFWWLWRCLPEAVCQSFNDSLLMLMPAETRIPDGSIWSHASLTSAIAGSLASYDLTTQEIKNWSANKQKSRPYIGVFSFSPVQELIKASRKMRDFWAGSWILHYLSARICWAIAWKYGPDTVLYPSLYAQPLIDYWLLHGLGEKVGDFQGWQHLPDFANFVDTPSDHRILTAGFPNVLVFILPQERVEAAMQTAKQVLGEEWQRIGKLSFQEIRDLAPKWMQGLEMNSNLWEGSLDSQWQSYWSAYPVGDLGEELRSSAIYKSNERDNWTKKQNAFCLLSEQEALFRDVERNFLIQAGELRRQKQGRHPFNINVGSWWNHIFDRTRMALAAVKKGRDWELPTAFGVRSTISGVGSALHAMPKESEDSIKQQWKKNQAGMFDGHEMLNASETLKRALHKSLPKLFPKILEDGSDRIEAAYPDLTAGVAGYLRTSTTSDRNHYIQVCQKITNQFEQTKNVISRMKGKWGIPYADDHYRFTKYHPRLLNAGWLVEDLELDDVAKKALKQEIEEVIVQKDCYPNNNPADWYVLAAGDGDGMSEWLKGKYLKNYKDYIPTKLLEAVQRPSNNPLESSVNAAFLEFVKQQKRMGASTHNALSRALLDFSNQLVPYLTEQRYAGRLIYGGGDDVLAYTNLWEWDQWLWDIRQCFRGSADPHGEFDNSGDYWRWASEESPIAKRPLFTMGSSATISFGIVIAHHSVPLAIALEEMWDAEEEGAKKHESPDGKQKDAVQIRVIYGNGNILKSTCKFDTFALWQTLLAFPSIEPAMFEQAATVWEQHPVPVNEAIDDWCVAFCDRREKLNDNKEEFRHALAQFIKDLWITTKEDSRDREVQNWLKLAAFILRKREIKINLLER
ncbi:MAG: type III-B CRISPR-associated protein Cas10/Cmr2 [Pseudanabaena sp. M046S1SP1A06QC]|nr:type III-B CRISPR-associated protein Cas10/Cmr2 [Pseudanabaena sp. M046S1SP1A06QC]